MSNLMVTCYSQLPKLAFPEALPSFEVFSQEISNMEDSSFLRTPYLYLSQLICGNRKRRIVLQVALNYALVRRIWLVRVSLLLLLLISNPASLHPLQISNISYFLHFKQVYLVPEKHWNHTYLTALQLPFCCHNILFFLSCMSFGVKLWSYG